MRRSSLQLVSGAVALALSTLVASEILAAPAVVNTQVSRVALFKNGLAFFIRQGELPARAGPVQVGPLPAASHGTLWLSFSPAVSFANLSTGEESALEQRDAVSLPELLRANVGKKVRVLFGSNDSLEGLLKAYQRAGKPSPPNPYLEAEARFLPQPGSEVVILETESGMVAFPPGSVSRIIFLETPLLQVTQEGSRVSLTGELVKTAPNQALTVSYLSKGLTWAPSYVIDVSQPKQGLLSAKAEIINEVEDLKDVSVDLVTGYPYLQFSDIVSPLARRENLTAFLNALGSGSSSDRSRREYGALTQQVMYNVGEMRAMPAQSTMPGYGTAATGVTAEDLFLYPLQKVTLARDHTGYYPLFSEKVAYEHVYEWEIPDYVTEQEQYRRTEQPQGTPQVVWHSLRLTNSTQLPWTTAPAETMLEGQILGQAMMPYTPPGGEALVKITQATSVHAAENELETNREVNALQRYGYSYDRITVEGKLLLHNFKDEAVTVKVTKTVTGEVQTSTPEAKVDKLAKGLRAENPRSRLTWEIPLAAGAETEITYLYRVLIRR